MFSLPLVLLVLFINVFGVIGDTPIFATATLHPDSNSSAKGFVIFTQLNPSSSVVVRGIINGLVPNTQYHGFHVHEKNPGNTTNCTAAGAHFNPYMKWHGGPDDTIDQRHVGDLGNIHSNEFGTAYVLINDSIIQLANQTQSILNRTIIVHRDVDDLGRGGQVDSNTTGHAGPRIACGVITIITDKSFNREFIEQAFDSAIEMEKMKVNYAHNLVHSKSFSGRGPSNSGNMFNYSSILLYIVLGIVVTAYGH